MSFSANTALERLIETGLRKPRPAVDAALRYAEFLEVTENGAREFGLRKNTSDPLPEMSKNRQGQLDAIMPERFRAALNARNVQPNTYRQLIDMQGLKAMQRPGG